MPQVEVCHLAVWKSCCFTGSKEGNIGDSFRRGRTGAALECNEGSVCSAGCEPSLAWAAGNCL